MTAAKHSTRVFEDGGFGEGWTAACTACNWEGTERVHSDVAQQEADLHTAVKAGRTWPCPRSDTYVEAEHEGAVRAVCPYCDLTVDVRPSYVSLREWRYMPHDMILDEAEGLSDAELADWWETDKGGGGGWYGGGAATERAGEAAGPDSCDVRRVPPAEAGRVVSATAVTVPTLGEYAEVIDALARHIGFSAASLLVRPELRDAYFDAIDRAELKRMLRSASWTRAAVGSDAYCDLTDTIDPGADEQ